MLRLNKRMWLLLSLALIALAIAPMFGRAAAILQRLRLALPSAR